MAIREETRSHIEQRSKDEHFLVIVPNIADVDSESLLGMLTCRAYYNGALDEIFNFFCTHPTKLAEVVAETCKAEAEADADYATWAVEVYGVEDRLIVRLEGASGDGEATKPCVCGGSGYVLDEHLKIARCYNCNP
jgi:hypothetical protein